MSHAPERSPGSPRDVGAALLRAWWVVALGVVFGVTAGAGVVLSLPARYVGSVTLLVQMPQGVDNTETLVRTVEALTRSTVLMSDIADQPGISSSAAEIADRLRVERAAGSAVLEVTVSERSEQQALRITEEFVPALQARLDEVSAADSDKAEGQVGSLPIRVVPFEQEPSVRAEARQPEFAGALGGMALGLVVAVVITARTGRKSRASD